MPWCWEMYRAPWKTVKTALLTFGCWLGCLQSWALMGFFHLAFRALRFQPKGTNGFSLLKSKPAMVCFVNTIAWSSSGKDLAIASCHTKAAGSQSLTPVLHRICSDHFSSLTLYFGSVQSTPFAAFFCGDINGYYLRFSGHYSRPYIFIRIK